MIFNFFKLVFEFPSLFAQITYLKIGFAEDALVQLLF